MSVPSRVLFAAREAGAAAALAPVATALAREGRYVPVVIGFQEAAAAFGRSGIPQCAFPEDPTAEQLERLMERERPRMVLTGTSVWPDRDGLLWEAAKRMGIPAAALLDHWSTARGRFSFETPFDRVPDVIAVIDESSQSEIRQLGFEGRTEIVGQPHLESVAADGAGLDGAAARHALGLDASRRTITFVSEPRSTSWGTASDAREDAGFRYGEQEVFEAVRAARDRVAPDALLVLKLHPLERAEAFGGLAEAADPDDIRVVSSCTAATLIAASDVITGMASMLLMEAHLGGVPTLSVRPGEAGVPAPWRGWSIPSVTSFEDVDGGLAAALERGRETPRPSDADGGSAVERCLGLIHELASHGVAA